MPRRTTVELDHIVLEVRDPGRSLTFYDSILGLGRVREREFLRGEAPFVSVRINEHSLIDLFPDGCGAAESRSIRTTSA